jgi:ABC-type transport system substrate-binding protein
MKRGALLLVAGAAMLAAAQLASASSPSRGIFRAGMEGASVQVDPQVAYVNTAWWLEYATAAKLFNWPDRGATKLVPEAASRFTVSDRGKKYTFFLRKGFRFSNGARR